MKTIKFKQVGYTVQVTSVTNHSLGERAGLTVGDIIFQNEYPYEPYQFDLFMLIVSATSVRPLFMKVQKHSLPPKVITAAASYPTTTVGHHHDPTSTHLESNDSFGPVPKKSKPTKQRRKKVTAIQHDLTSSEFTSNEVNIPNLVMPTTTTTITEPNPLLSQPMFSRVVPDGTMRTTHFGYPSLP